MAENLLLHFAPAGAGPRSLHALSVLESLSHHLERRTHSITRPWIRKQTYIFNYTNTTQTRARARARALAPARVVSIPCLRSGEYTPETERQGSNKCIKTVTTTPLLRHPLRKTGSSHVPEETTITMYRKYIIPIQSSRRNSSYAIDLNS